ncbi:lantibiotic dehydratase [Streptomyces parvus]|uniref:Lantibiotic dehydratase n=1 Tax=Streptomyces parvus TaxID=66428 RepID=A0A5D4JGG4_9ACTN|nr:lantibiotic dehydratase [Streptomyces parvus]TYR62713.1 lantibiotic dehydratase [Streptomyces parvus]
MNDSPWQLLPTFVVRTAGFPWHLVEQLGYEKSRRLATELTALEETATALGATAAPRSRLPRSAKSRLRNLRPLPADAPFPADWLEQWNEATGQLEHAAQQYAATVEAEAPEVLDAMTQMVSDPRFLDAVVCSSPAAYRELRKGLRGARLRRQAASYAQRFAAKCETMSFFGPINYGQVNPAQPQQATWNWDGYEAVPGRRAFTAARATHRIQEAILCDAAVVARLVPRRKTWLAVPGTGLTSRLVRSADGTATVAGLATALGAELPAAVAAFRVAVDRGLITHQWCPPATVADPVAWLSGRLAEQPDGLNPALRSLVRETGEVLERYPAAEPMDKIGLQTRITELLAGAVPADTQPLRQQDQPTVRSRFYNDRVIIHEAAVGTLDLTLGADAAHDLRHAVAPLLDLLAHDAELTRHQSNSVVAERLGAGRTPLLTAMKQCADLPYERSTWLPDRIREAVVAAPEGTSDLDLRDLDDLAGAPGGPEELKSPGAPVMCSVDVMIETAGLEDYRAGETSLVLGDIHDAALLTPWALQFHPDGGRLREERDDAISRVLGTQQAVTVIARRTTGLPPLEFPGLVLELGGTSERQDAPRIGLDALYVESDGQRATLRADGLDAPLMFHNGELDTAFHTAFALPRIRRPHLPRLPHVPRLRRDNVLLSRRRWTVDSAEVTAIGAASGDADRIRAAARLCAVRSLPDTFFAKSENERKPIYVDTASPSLLDCLIRLAATAKQLVLSEVTPGPATSWLHHGESRCAAELRCVYLRGAV